MEEEELQRTWKSPYLGSGPGLIKVKGKLFSYVYYMNILIVQNIYIKCDKSVAKARNMLYVEEISKGCEVKVRQS